VETYQPRWGLTIPLEDRGLDGLPGLAAEVSELGYTDLWTSEVDYADGLTPLAAVAASAPLAQLGTAILPAFTRGPAVLASSAAAMATLAPGRFWLGIGASSPAVVQQWNAVEFRHPYERTRDMLAFLREALTGARVDREYETFTVTGFRLRLVPQQAPPILLAALRPRMLRLAGSEADGAITNWLSADDVPKVRDAMAADKHLVARIMVCPTTDTDIVRAQARRLIATYLTVNAYAEFQRWLGRGPALMAMSDRWDAGDRKGALTAIADSVVDELIVYGSPQDCADHIQRYVANGVTVPVLHILPFGIDALEAARSLSPAYLSQSGRPANPR
jgi:probable F420-dependent oxidoreductase